MAYKTDKTVKGSLQKGMEQLNELRAKKKAEKEARRMQRQASKGDRNAMDDVKRVAAKLDAKASESVKDATDPVKRKKRKDASKAKAQERAKATADSKDIGTDIDMERTPQAVSFPVETDVEEPEYEPIPVQDDPVPTEESDPGEDDTDESTEGSVEIIGEKDTYIAPPELAPEDPSESGELFRDLMTGTPSKKVSAYVNDSDGNMSEVVADEDNRLRELSVGLRTDDESPVRIPVVDRNPTETMPSSLRCPRCNKTFALIPGKETETMNGEPVCYDCDERIRLRREAEENGITSDGTRAVYTRPEPEGQRYYDPDAAVTAPLNSEYSYDDTYDDPGDSDDPETPEEPLETPDEDEESAESDEEPIPDTVSPVERVVGVISAVIGGVIGAIGSKRKPKKKDERKDDDKPVKKEKDPDPDSFGERFRRWKLVRFDGYVKLRTLYRDDATGEFVSETTLVKRKDLPHDAVQCTGEKGFYCHDKIKDSDWYNSNHYRNMALLEYQFTASDAALYMQSNKIDNALAVNWTQSSHKDPTKTIILMGAIIVVGIVVATRFM